MNAVEQFRNQQWQLLEDDNEQFEQSINDYCVSAEYISGLVLSIRESADDLGVVSTGSSNRARHDHFTQSSESHHSVLGRATHITLQQKNGNTTSHTVYSGKHESPLADVNTNEAVSLCLLSEQLANDAKKPRVVMAYSHANQKPKWFMPSKRPELLASGNLFKHLFRYAIKTPVIITLIGLAIYVGSFMVFQRKNPLEPFFEGYLQFIAQAYSYTMELLVLSNICSWKTCTPGQVPGGVGGGLWSFGVLVALGLIIALLASYKHRKRVQNAFRVFNQVRNWANTKANHCVKHYQQKSPAIAKANTDAQPRTSSAHKTLLAPEKTFDFQAPEGERRYQVAITQKSFYLNDVVERIESFSTETIEKSSIVKGKVHYHNAPLTRSQETFEHRTFVYADKANYQRSIIGLLDNGEKTSAILPEGFALGAMQQGDVITSFEVTFKDFLKKKPYGTSALINKTQGTLTLAEDLQPATDELITPKFDIANGGLGLLAGAAIIGFIFGIAGSLGALLLISIVSFTVAIVAGVKVKRARIKRSQRLARFVEQRLKALINAP